MQVMVDGLLTSYEASGKGKVIVLLHGWGDRATGLKPLQQALSHYYSVVAPDLPGFGGTTPPKTAWGLTDYATFVAHFLKKIDMNAYAIIGHSNGGAIVLRGIGQGTLQADKLVLLASAGIRNQYNGRNRVLRLVTKTGKVLALPLPKNLKQKLRRKVYKTIGSDMLVAEHLQATFRKIVTDDVQADAKQINIPTLMLYGENDSQAPVQYGEIFHELIEGSTLEILPGAGHFLHLDRPQEVTESIEGFLR